MNEMSSTFTQRKLAQLQHLSALFIYVLLSLALFGVRVIPKFSTSYLGRGADPSIFIWDLVWWPYALAHHLNPFIPKVVWAPIGYNLAWATSLPGPSMIMAPMTTLFGPVVSYNCLCLLGPALAAWCTFLLCRHICKRFCPALLAGYIFGFSSYMLGQMRGHLFLVLVFPVPLAIYLALLRLDEVLTVRSFVILLVPVLALQFLTSTEVFATLTLFAALGLFLSYSLAPSGSSRRAVAKLTRLILLAYCLLLVVVSPYLYYVLALGEPAPINAAVDYSADLLNFVLPTRITLFGDRLLPITERFRGNLSENGAYLGPGLLITIALFGWRYLRTFSGELLMLGLIFVFVGSLGPRMHIGGTLGIPLLWIVVSKMPLIDQALPCRLSLFMFLIVAIMAAICLSDNYMYRSAKLTLAVCCIVFLLPVGQTPVSQAEIPLVFRHGNYRHYFKHNDTVLVLPYGVRSRSLLWQAYSDMYFRLAIARLGVIPPAFAEYTIFREFQSGNPAPGSAERLKAFLSAHHVNTIIVDPRSPGSWPDVLSSIGAKALQVDDVILYNVTLSQRPIR